MNERMIVMNGFRILQSPDDGRWKTIGTIKKVEKGVAAGIYNLFLAKDAKANAIYEGIILYVDKKSGFVFQQVNKEFISHKQSLFKTTPAIGKNVSIRYDNNQLIT